MGVAYIPPNPDNQERGVVYPNRRLNPSMVSCLSALPGESRFIIGGKRLLLFTNDLTKKDLKTFNEELAPLTVTFNPYFNTFHVVTKHDMRVYDAFTGKLRKVFTELQDERQPGDNTAFQMGARNRKFLIGDNIGQIRLYNIKSGDLIQPLVTYADIKDRAGMKPRNSDDKTARITKRSQEVVQLIFVEEQKILISASSDSVIRVYETKPSEDVELLRELRGGHNDSDLTCAIYSRETLTLYSGAVNGSIAMWSFESSRIVGYLRDEDVDITCMRDLFPYPALLAANSRGIVNCWRTIDLKKSYPLIFKLCVYDELSALPLKSINAMIHLKSTHPIVDPTGFSRPLYKQEIYEKEGMKRQFESDECELAPLPALRSMMAPYFTSAGFNQSSYYMYIGSASGNIQVYSVSAIMNAKGIDPLSTADYNLKRGDKFKISLMRKDNINADKTADKLGKEILQLRGKEKYPVWLDSTVYLKMWRAHKDTICSVDAITPTIQGFSTSGKDKMVRFWSSTGELWGQFSIISLDYSFWRFPYDWVNLILNDLEEVFRIVERLDKIDISIKQKEALQVRYLYKNFIMPEVKLPKPKANDAGILQKLQFFNRLTGRDQSKPSQPQSDKPPLTGTQTSLGKVSDNKDKESVKEKEKPVALPTVETASPEPRRKEGNVNAYRYRYDIDKTFWEGLDKQRITREKQAGRSNMHTDWSNLAVRCRKRFDGEPIEDSSPSPEDHKRDDGRKKKLKLRKKSGNLDLGKNTLDDVTNKFRISGLPRPVSLQSLGHPPMQGWDVRAQQGEYKHALRKATLSALSNYQSNVGGRISSEMECLRATSRYNTSILRNLSQPKKIAPKSALPPKPTDLEQELEKIVAKKSFFLNPTKNDPKIIQTKNRLYVV
jgi:WD40 repeat protein